MSRMIECEEITTARVLSSRFVEAILPYLKLDIEKHDTLQHLFSFLGNSTRSAPEIAKIYVQEGVAKYAIDLVKKRNPSPHSKMLR